MGKSYINGGWEVRFAINLSDHTLSERLSAVRVGSQSMIYLNPLCEQFIMAVLELIDVF